MATPITTGTIVVDYRKKNTPLTFWQVTSKSNRTLKMREIPATPWTTDKDSEALYTPDLTINSRARAMGYNLDTCISIQDNGLPGYLYPWNGKPITTTPQNPS